MKIFPILASLSFLLLQGPNANAQSTRTETRVRHSRLICKTDGLSKAAIYDYYRGEFVDDYYSKTLDECYETIRRSRRGFTCITYMGKAALYDYYRGYAVDDYYSKTLRQCWSEL